MSPESPIRLRRGHTCSVSGTCTQDPCAAGYTWNGSVCAAAVQCSTGSYDPPEAVRGYAPLTLPLRRMPIPVSPTAVSPGARTVMCFDPTRRAIKSSRTTTAPCSRTTDSGTLWATASGDLYIFSGRSMECKTSGQESGWKNCCMSGDAPARGRSGKRLLHVGTFSTITQCLPHGAGRVLRQYGIGPGRLRRPDDRLLQRLSGGIKRADHGGPDRKTSPRVS